MKKQTDNTSKQSYDYVEKNIYKTGSRYRIRVGTFSAYEPTREKARKRRALLKYSNKSTKIW